MIKRFSIFPIQPRWARDTGNNPHDTELALMNAPLGVVYLEVFHPVQVPLERLTNESCLSAIGCDDPNVLFPDAAVQQLLDVGKDPVGLPLVHEGGAELTPFMLRDGPVKEEGEALLGQPGEVFKLANL